MLCGARVDAEQEGHQVQGTKVFSAISIVIMALASAGFINYETWYPLIAVSLDDSDVSASTSVYHYGLTSVVVEAKANPFTKEGEAKSPCDEDNLGTACLWTKTYTDLQTFYGCDDSDSSTMQLSTTSVMDCTRAVWCKEDGATSWVRLKIALWAVILLASPLIFCAPTFERLKSICMPQRIREHPQEIQDIYIQRLGINLVSMSVFLCMILCYRTYLSDTYAQCMDGIPSEPTDGSSVYYFIIRSSPYFVGMIEGLMFLTLIGFCFYSRSVHHMHRNQLAQLAHEENARGRGPREAQAIPVTAGMGMGRGMMGRQGPPVAAAAHYMEQGQEGGNGEYVVVMVDGVQTEVPQEAAVAYSPPGHESQVPTVAHATPYKPVSASGSAGVPYTSHGSNSNFTSTSAAALSRDEALARALARADAAEAELAELRRLD